MEKAAAKKGRKGKNQGEGGLWSRSGSSSRGILLGPRDSRVAGACLLEHEVALLQLPLKPFHLFCQGAELGGSRRIRTRGNEAGGREGLGGIDTRGGEGRISEGEREGGSRRLEGNLPQGLLRGTGEGGR